ncbi:MAG: AraC family transcriptional regulator [Chthoniobacteraceae bacterium]|nr:AraC family transcriptional regulator [Chthoniobacteraceae bacterium]
MRSGANPGFFRWPLGAQPRVRLAGWFPFEPGSVAGRCYRHPTVALHQHFYHARLFVEGGAVIALRPGDVTWSLPDRRTRYELAEPGHHWCVHFNAAAARTAKCVKQPLHLPLGAAGAYVTERFRAIADLQGRLQRAPRNGLLEAAVSLSMQELIFWLALQAPGRGGAGGGAKAEAAVEEARLLLDAHFGRPLAAHEVTQTVGLSRNYLAARFRKRFGATMENYLLRRRIEVARHLLFTTDFLIKEVAFRVGIPDPQYFNKQFRRIVGMSPCAFRQSVERGTDW